MMASRRSSRPRRRGGRRGRARALAWLAVLTGAATYVLVAGVPSPNATSQAAGDVDITVGEVLDRAVENASGSVTVTLTEAETAALVRDGLARSQAPPLRDVDVDLVAADNGQQGQMIVGGTLADRPLPVRATVDLAVVDAAVRPTVRAATVGPVSVPESVRKDLNRQLRQLVVIADRNIVVEDLRTTDTTLVLTGKRR